MKKVYYFMVAVCAIVFAHWIFTSLPTFSGKLLTVASNSISTSAFSSNGTFAFKSTSERTDLVKQMVYINSEFMKTMPIEASENNVVKNFYKLEQFFPTFKYYYIAKLKVRNAIYTELPILYDNTHALSDLELQEYFNNNIDYLEEKWGINDFSKFAGIVSTIKQTNGKKIASCELEDSYFYTSSTGVLNFRIIVTLEDTSTLYVNAKAYSYETNEYQSAPIVRFLGIIGGASHV